MVSGNRIQVVPLLVVDQHISGVYDTVIPDMSTSWEDFAGPADPDGPAKL